MSSVLFGSPTTDEAFTSQWPVLWPRTPHVAALFDPFPHAVSALSATRRLAFLQDSPSGAPYRSYGVLLCMTARVPLQRCRDAAHDQGVDDGTGPARSSRDSRAGESHDFD